MKPNRPRRFGGVALLYFSRLDPVIFTVTLRNQGSVSKKHVWLLKMGKRDLLTVQVLSPALAVLRACAGHPKCQRTDQQPAADGENQKRLRPWAAFCAVFWVLCLDQRQGFLAGANW